MYSTVKIGKVFINLESVAEVVIRGERSCRIFYNVVFSDGQSNRDLFDDEAVAFMAYMNSHSRDVMAEYEASKRVQERISARQEVVDTDMIKLYNEV